MHQTYPEIISVLKGGYINIDMRQRNQTNYRYKYKFCPSCGVEFKLSVLKLKEPFRRVCYNCGFIDYQNPKLVVNSIIEYNGKIILLKRDRKFGSGKWSFPGGYMDKGETFEGAAKREAQEECGVDIKIKYLLDLYSYPGKCEIVAIYVAEYLSGELIAGDETSEARFVSPEKIPWDKLAFPSIELALKDYLNRNNIHHKSAKIHTFPSKDKVPFGLKPNLLEPQGI